MEKHHTNHTTQKEDDNRELNTGKEVENIVIPIKNPNKDNEEDLESRNNDQPHTTNTTLPNDPGDGNSNFLKLISGTSLEEDHDDDNICIKKHGHEFESSIDDEEGYNGDEGDSFEALDHEEEMRSFEATEEYASMDKEEEEEEEEEEIAIEVVDKSTEEEVEDPFTRKTLTLN
ncbi:hypothetical protein HAX54_011781 [Datura stramonium]|uniref:Uncharacterized protein n=1 Tax=Datura stramonium TaxID=4076 RepID=A0ABS8TKD8_DATST|nr:hypothetical protein [Datura stramonium]